MTLSDRILHRFAQLCVLATLGLIFLGGMVTSKGVGLSVPDWPLSFGTLNPEGWWHIESVRLEHGHRLYASVVGLLTGIVTAWVWRSRMAFPAALATVVLAVLIGKVGNLPAAVRMHLGIWPPAVAFLAALLWEGRTQLKCEGRAARWLAVAAFLLVCIQATLGGLRVTEMSIVFAIVHGCVGQIYLCVLVALAVTLSPGWLRGGWEVPAWVAKPLRVIPWVLVGALFTQLILGAVTRHIGAGLAIADFPLSDGRLVPSLERLSHFGVLVHYLHRLGAVAVSLVTLALVGALFFAGRGDGRLIASGVLLVALVAFQIALGAHVIWLTRPPGTTTLHVLNGALILASAVMLAIRGTATRAGCRSAGGAATAESSLRSGGRAVV